MKVGIIFLAGLLTIVGAQNFLRAQNDENKAHQQWLEERYKEAASIKPGMTRADLRRLFSEDGGFHSTSEWPYVLKSCSLIKISVKFDKYDFSNRRLDDQVRIVEVSKPYLEPMFLD